MNFCVLGLILKYMDNSKVDIKKIKKMAQWLLEKIDPAAEISTVAGADGAVKVEINAVDAQAIIGQNGETLRAITHLLRVMARKEFAREVLIEADANGYLEKRKNYLRQLAVSTANDVSLLKKEIVLPPMNSYERRVVHMELADRADIATESRGEGISRRIAIKPAE